MQESGPACNYQAGVADTSHSRSSELSVLSDMEQRREGIDPGVAIVERRAENRAAMTVKTLATLVRGTSQR